MKPNGRDIIQRIKRTILWIYYETQRTTHYSKNKHPYILYIHTFNNDLI
jgi:hypothetical protein